MLEDQARARLRSLELLRTPPAFGYWMCPCTGPPLPQPCEVTFGCGELSRAQSRFLRYQLSRHVDRSGIELLRQKHAREVGGAGHHPGNRLAIVLIARAPLLEKIVDTGDTLGPGVGCLQAQTDAIVGECELHLR